MVYACFWEIKGVWERTLEGYSILFPSIQLSLKQSLKEGTMIFDIVLYSLFYVSTFFLFPLIYFLSFIFSCFLILFILIFLNWQNIASLGCTSWSPATLLSLTDISSVHLLSFQTLFCSLFPWVQAVKILYILKWDHVKFVFLCLAYLISHLMYCSLGSSILKWKDFPFVEIFQ